MIHEGSHFPKTLDIFFVILRTDCTSCRQNHAGGVWVSFSNDKSHEFHISYLKQQTDVMNLRREGKHKYITPLILMHIIQIIPCQWQKRSAVNVSYSVCQLSWKANLCREVTMIATSKMCFYHHSLSFFYYLTKVCDFNYRIKPRLQVFWNAIAGGNAEKVAVLILSKK